jgi:NADH:ubiquinone oxidoreductase subunit 4 (subunit M)
VEITIVMVVSTMEDDKIFSIINFMKSKLCNCFTTHLDLVVRMYVQKFYRLEIFPFYTIIKEWGKEKLQYGEE